MANILKPLLAFIISVLLFAGFAWLADTGLLEFVQTRFYNPSIYNSFEKDNAANAGIVENHIYDLQKRFAAVLTDPPVRRSFLYNQSADDIFERSRIFGILTETTGGLQSVQFVDSNGLRIHYSTLPRDIISQNINSTSYRNYNEDPLALPYDAVSVPSGGSEKFTMDEQTERMIFSFPFFDSTDVYRGTALFTISVRALADRLVEEGRLKFNEDVSFINEPAGILLGSPVSSKAEIRERVTAIWNRGELNRITIDAEESGAKFSLISFKTQKGLFFGRLINDHLFTIPESMKLIFLLSVFLTFFLSLFFLFNIKPNAVVLVQNRIKRLRESLFEHLYVNKSAQERTKWILELEQRRDEIRSELKRNLKLKPKLDKTINGIINKSWDELLSVLNSGVIQYVPVDAAEAEQIQTLKTKKAESLDDAGAILQIADLEEVESLEEVEPLEEVEALEEVESLEEVEALEEIETLEEIEALEEAGALTETALQAAAPEKAKPKWKDLGEFEELLRKATSDETPEKRSNAKQSGIAKHGSLLLKAEKLAAKKRTGLLARAEAKERKKTGLLARAEAKERKPKKTGLLARVIALQERLAERKAAKGLLAAVSNFERDEIIETEADEHEQEHEVGEIAVVSPFSSMFASLRKD